MTKLNVRLGVVGLSLLAAASMTAASALPAAATGASHPSFLTGPSRTRVALPMLCPEPKDPNTVQVMIDIDSTYARQSADWSAPAVGRLVKFQCFDVVGRNKNAEWLLIPYGTSQAWIAIDHRRDYRPPPAGRCSFRWCAVVERAGIAFHITGWIRS